VLCQLTSGHSDAASTLYQRRQVNVRKCKRNSWARKQTILTNHSSATERKIVEEWRWFRSSNYLVARLVTCQNLGNSRCHTGNFVEQQSCATKLLDFVACLTWASATSGYFLWEHASDSDHALTPLLPSTPVILESPSKASV